MTLQDALALALALAALAFLGARLLRRRRCCDAGRCEARRDGGAKAGEGAPAPPPMEV